MDFRIIALKQEFNFNMYEGYTVSFAAKPQHRDDVLFIRIGKQYGSNIECMVDKITGDIVYAEHCGTNKNTQDAIDKASNIFGMCGYTKEKLVYIAKFVYDLGEFQCQPYMCGKNHNNAVAARLQ